MCVERRVVDEYGEGGEAPGEQQERGGNGGQVGRLLQLFICQKTTISFLCNYVMISLMEKKMQNPTKQDGFLLQLYV